MRPDRVKLSSAKARVKGIKGGSVGVPLGPLGQVLTVGSFRSFRF